MYDIKVEIEMFDHQRVRMFMANFSNLHNVAKAALGLSISSQLVCLRCLNRERLLFTTSNNSFQEIYNKQREKGGGLHPENYER